MDQAPPQGWAQEDNALTRTIKRKDFVEALAFLLAVGHLAEKNDHHPDVDLRYHTLHFRLTTHDAGHTITPKDFLLAEEINGLTDDLIRSITQELRPRLSF